MVAERTQPHRLVHDRPSPVIARLRGVTKAFGRPPAALEVLHGVDLDVHAGRLTLLTGPSGSGKTTLLTILGLLLRPTAGRVEIAGRDVTGCTESELPAVRRRHVSFIFQSFNLLGALSASENVEVMLGLHGMKGSSAVRRARELLARVGLADRASHRPDELSGGERQRVGIARALASPAELILADEPTGNLDGATALRVIAMLHHLAHEEGRAVLVVTHDPRLEAFADRILPLEDGRLRAGGVEDTK